MPMDVSPSIASKRYPKDFDSSRKVSVRSFVARTSPVRVNALKAYKFNIDCTHSIEGIEESQFSLSPASIDRSMALINPGVALLVG